MPLDVTVTSPNLRFVIVHYHIFKNGGSTIESILEREFRQRFATLHEAQPFAALDGKHLASFLRRHSGIAAVSSHHLRYPKPALRNTIIFDCCFLRQPLERLDSIYRYHRMIPPVDSVGYRAHRMSPRDFLRSLLDESPHLVSNVQVTQLACAGSFTRPANLADLEQAAATFHQMAIPGLVEMFDESLTAAEYFLKPAFPELKLEYVPQNVTRTSESITPLHSQDRAERLADTWGGDLYEDLLKLNQLDLEMFRRATEEIGRRIALVPQSQSRLSEFRMRCSQLLSRTQLDRPEPQREIA